MIICKFIYYSDEHASDLSKVPEYFKNVSQLVGRHKYYADSIIGRQFWEFKPDANSVSGMACKHVDEEKYIIPVSVTIMQQ